MRDRRGLGDISPRKILSESVQRRDAEETVRYAKCATARRIEIIESFDGQISRVEKFKSWNIKKKTKGNDIVTINHDKSENYAKILLECFA